MRRAAADYRPQQRYIHIEIEEDEITGLLNELTPEPSHNTHLALELIRILRQAHDDFRRGTPPRRRTPATT
ncbi:hypothetical protein [Streptomyces sp. NPDC101455]|uniref:hypothetical protein n=1 Tax=Streptomyces sp. NPDC101455 TaxID=3366142 RepID=UPI0037FD343E